MVALVRAALAISFPKKSKEGLSNRLAIRMSVWNVSIRAFLLSANWRKQ